MNETLEHTAAGAAIVAPIILALIYDYAYDRWYSNRTWRVFAEAFLVIVLMGFFLPYTGIQFLTSWPGLYQSLGALCIMFYTTLIMFNRIFNLTPGNKLL
jgi:phosphotransferase system  glucose/maltose/N-acetylglucosamine-specific IIC component